MEEAKNKTSVLPDAGSYLKSSSWFGAKLLAGPSLPHGIYFCPFRSSTRGMLWVPSTRESGPRKIASSALMPTLWNVISPRLTLPQPYCFFVRHFKNLVCHLAWGSGSKGAHFMLKLNTGCYEFLYNS